MTSHKISSAWMSALSRSCLASSPPSPRRRGLGLSVPLILLCVGVIIPLLFVTCEAGSGQTCNSSISQCQNNGTCVDGDWGFTCNCSQEFTGLSCGEQRNQSCSPDLCNNGTCKNVNITIAGAQESSFECECVRGFKGPLCEVRYNGCHSQPPPCANGSACTINQQHPFYTCDCSATDYEGENCTEKIDNCLEITCGGHGNCSDHHRDYKCNCDEGWEGKNCTVDINECQPGTGTHNCMNGTCANTDGSFRCDCTPGFTGSRCGTEINECSPDPCHNDGVCVDKVNDYSCDCSGTGREGKNCTEDINECQPGTGTHNCMNGSCANTNGSFRCDCTPGFTGSRCGTEINECSPDPCHNDGVCVDKVNDYSCDCSGTGFRGKNCADDIDECNETASICNHGNCVNTNGSFDCDCIDGYQGVTCEKKRVTDDEDDVDIALIVGPIVGGLLFIIIIIVIIGFVMTTRSKRATRGAYSPSQQETTGSRVELGSVLKKPPEERLI